jgi:hypothetical protein
MDRKCTDILCLAVFLAFLGCMMAATMYGYKKGDPDMYMAPLDRHDNFCGFSTGFEAYPDLYLTNLKTSKVFDYGVCVKKCPSVSTDTIECPENESDKALCSSPDQMDRVYKTNSVFGYCMPSIVELKKDRPDAYKNWQFALDEMMKGNAAGRGINDMY